MITSLAFASPTLRHSDSPAPSVSDTPRHPVSAVLLFAPSEDESAEFEALPDSIKDDVRRGLIAFEKIHAAKNVSHACKQVAHQMAGRRGWSFDRLRSKYYDYARTGDWRILVDYARVPKRLKPDAVAEAATDLPRDFIECLKGLMQSNQRKSEPAIRLLYRMWRRGDSIPGYGTWQEWFFETHPHEPLPTDSTGTVVCPPEMPVGWSKGNLRRYIPEEAELELSRRGVAAARSYLPDILTTRDGLRPLECIMFDDVKTDFKIMVPGFESPVDLALLVAFDVATGMILRYGLRPAILRDDGARDRLKLRDMKVLIAGLLLQYGVPRSYPMTLVVENQTATVREGTAMALAQISSNQIACSKTMMINGTALFGGYKDRALGNPNGKAPLESTFNLMHNELGFQPGQVGRRYDAGPAELHGRTREAESLARTSRHLTPQQRAALRYPFLDTDQARLVITDAFNRMIRRTEHVMEGFAPVGEWRLKEFEPWRPEWELAEAGFAPDQVKWNPIPRKESPFERWERLRESVGGDQNFSKLHPGAVARLYDEQKPVTVDCGEITFTFEKKQYVYRVADTKFAPAPLHNGCKALCWFDPQDLSWIHLTAADGGFLGSIPRTRGINRLDKVGHKKEMDRVRDQLHELQDRVSARMPQIAEQRLEDLTHNNAVLAEAIADAEAINLAPAIADAPTAPLPECVSQMDASRYQLKVATRKAAARKNTEADLAAAADEALMSNLR